MWSTRLNIKNPNGNQDAYTINHCAVNDTAHDSKPSTIIIHAIGARGALHRSRLLFILYKPLFSVCLVTGLRTK